MEFFLSVIFAFILGFEALVYGEKFIDDSIPGYKETITRCENYIDSLIKDAQAENDDYNPYQVNKTVLPFQTKFLFIKYTAKAQITKGYIQGLNTFKRVSSCSLSVDGNRLSLSAMLQSQPIFYNLTGILHAIAKGPAFAVWGDYSSTEVVMSMGLNYETGEDLQLEAFTIGSMGDFNDSARTLKKYFLNYLWAEEPVKNQVATYVKWVIKKLVRSEQKDIIEERMAANPFSMAGIELDIDKIKSGSKVLNSFTFH